MLTKVDFENVYTFVQYQIMDVDVEGFDWDEGHQAKCQKYGVSVKEVEGLFSRPLLILPDAAHSHTEERR